MSYHAADLGIAYTPFFEQEEEEREIDDPKWNGEYICNLEKQAECYDISDVSTVLELLSYFDQEAKPTPYNWAIRKVLNTYVNQLIKI